VSPSDGVDPFIAQPKHLYASYWTRAKWVFVLSHSIGRTLGDRLVLEGTDWADLRLRYSARHRPPHGCAIPRRTRHRAPTRGLRSGADDPVAAQLPRAVLALPTARRASHDGAVVVGHQARASQSFTYLHPTRHHCRVSISLAGILVLARKALQPRRAVRLERQLALLMADDDIPRR
jgi:hypothetical protein